MKNAFWPFISRKGSVRAKILFAPSAAQFVLNQELTTVKKTRCQPDGSLLVEMVAEGGKPLVHGLLGFGSNATVIEPTSLQKQVEEDALKIVAKYASAKERKSPKR